MATAVGVAICLVLLLCPRPYGPRLAHDIGRGFIICMEDCRELQIAIGASLEIGNVTAWKADRGENASGLPLYAQHVIDWGRHDHMQIANRAALGCLRSHMGIWRHIAARGEGPVAVFEEDALIHGDSAALLAELWHDVRDEPWELLMLERGQIHASGKWAALGTHASRCDGRCTWLGTRGYVVTPKGAQILLEHSEPQVVQVDALISLVAEFDPRFRLVVTRRNVVDAQWWKGSYIWDACLKCMVPEGWGAYGLVGVVVLTGVLLFKVIQFY